MSNHELKRSETAICALSSTTLEWDTWALDALTALGMAAIRNPLGDKLIHFIDAPLPSTAQEITLIVSSRLIRRGHDPARTLDAAFQAFDYWNSRRCLHCGGRGVLNFQQQPCTRCNGSGERLPPQGNELVEDAIAILIEAENQMEGQLRRRMSPTEAPSEHRYGVRGAGEGKVRLVGEDG